MVPVQFLVTDEQLPTGEPLEDVVVRVYDEFGVVLVTEGTTDEGGELIFELPENETYWIRFFKTGIAFLSRLFIEVEPGAETFDVVGRRLSAQSDASDAALCRVTGTLLAPNGLGAERLTLYFMQTQTPQVVNGCAVLPSKVYTQADATGRISIDLLRSAAYDVWVAGAEDRVFRVKTPNYPRTGITDLLFPLLVAIETSASSVLVTRGILSEVDVTATLSSRVTVPYLRDDQETVPLAEYCTIVVEDPTVVRGAFVASRLQLEGLAAGTTQVRLVRKTSTLVRTPDPGTLEHVLSVTVFG